MKSSLQKKRKNIGVLINSIDGLYQSLVWNGIKAVSEEKGFNLLIFSGMSLESKIRDEAQHNVIYNLINTEKIDGLIIDSGPLMNFVGLENLINFIEKYKSVPIVSVFISLPGIHSVLMNNKDSMKLAVDHLINEHRYSKIAYIKGLVTSDEAKERFEGYKEVLSKNNIPLDANMIFQGNFRQEAGAEAVDYFLAQGKIKPDAIVCSNDEMAIGAFHRITELGLKVPEDIALVGFDNIETVLSFSPPFTTVDQPFYKMAKRAAEIMNDLLNGENPPLLTYLNGELVIRQSCGCSKFLKNKCIELPTENLTPRTSLEEILLLEKEISTIEEYVFDSIPQYRTTLSSIALNKCRQLINTLLKCLISDIKDRRLDGSFMSEINSILVYYIIQKRVDFPWKEALISAKKFILNLVSNAEVIIMVQEIFFMAFDLVNDVLLRKELLNQFNFKKMYIESRYIIQQFNSALSLEELIEALRISINVYGIDKCYFCLYDQPIKNNHSESFSFPPMTKLIYGFKNGKELAPRYFYTKDMLPEELINTEDRDDLVFITLFSGSDHYGYMVCGTKSVDEHIFETLREHISNVLKTQFIFNELKHTEEKLNAAVNKLKIYNKELHSLSIKDELTGLYNRRGFYIRGDLCFNTAKIRGEKFTLFFGDLDGLKKINDNYGHNEGDNSLKAAAHILRKSFRSEVVVARISGDEFTIIEENISSVDEINLILKNIDTNLNQYNKLSGKPYKVGISLGYSIFDPKSDASLQYLVEEADRKLYELKKIKKLSAI